MSRKYRQRGYQDEDQPPQRQRRKPPRERKEGPRGRGLGAPAATVFRCARCGFKQKPPGARDFAARCPQCATALHTCTNCIHFDTSARFECRKPIPERIRKKATANECELYAAKTTQEFVADRAKPDDPRAAFDALFDS